MSRRANYGHRCKACLMHMSLCICALIPRLETRTRLILVLHKAEVRKPTNTGQLAAAALVNSTVVVRGLRDLREHLEHEEREQEPPLVWPADSEPLLLFPHGDAAPLEPTNHPVSLIVPDGNWRQAAKVRARVPGLKDIRCVTLPPGPPTEYRLRSESNPVGLATIEAIARAFGILEGPLAGPAVQTALERVFRTMVERTLWVRGSLATADVTGGIPEGVQKHDPRGRQG